MALDIKDGADDRSVEERLARIEQLLHALVLHLGVPIGRAKENADDVSGLTVGSPVPIALDHHDLMRHLGLTKSAFYKHQAAGRFDRFLAEEPNRHEAVQWAPSPGISQRRQEVGMATTFAMNFSISSSFAQDFEATNTG